MEKQGKARQGKRNKRATITRRVCEKICGTKQRGAVKDGVSGTLVS